VDTFTTSGYYHTTTGSAQRLPNGNTLCVESDNGSIREWDSAGAVVWSYQAAANTPSAFKYAPDHPGIVALLGTAAAKNPLLHPGRRPDARREAGALAFYGVAGARLEIYALSGRRLFAGTADGDPFRWTSGSPREPYFVRLRRDARVETLRIAPEL
jgi:hypothetical protein